jgi:Protein of unknown function (DUF4007)
MAKIEFPSKPTFSGHETFALRQLWLKKAFDQVASSSPSGAPKSLFTDDSAISRFGVGKNMVASIKHWGLACDVIKDTEAGYEIGEIGNLLFGADGCDSFLESDSTLWLIHWLLAGKAKRSATWYVLFNYVNSPSFQAENIIQLIQEFSTSMNSSRSNTTFARDVEVCLRCYSSVGLKNVTEDSAEPLLTDLALLSNSNGVYQFNRGQQSSLRDEVFVYALLDFWQRLESEKSITQKTLSFNVIAHDYGSPGRVFKLSEDSVADRLSNIAETTNRYLDWTDSAGLRQVSRLGKDSLQTAKMNILRKAYD